MNKFIKDIQDTDKVLFLNSLKVGFAELKQCKQNITSLHLNLWKYANVIYFKVSYLLHMSVENLPNNT